MNDNAIEVRGLVKRYGDVLAIGGIDLDVRRGELLAFLGLNGAGKSTTINIICTLLKKDAGKVRVNGYDADAAPERVRAGIGVVFQSSVLDNMLTVRENLTVRAGLYGMGSGAAKARICELAQKYNTTMTCITLAWHFKKGVSSPIIGATKTKYLDDAAGAFNVDLTDEDVAYIDELYVPHKIVGAL